MSDFKGTKGKWYLQEFTDAYTNIIRCDNGVHSTLYLASTSQSSNSEERYNAQVMAHSKDMLELLQHFVDNNMLSIQGELEAKCLIKSATEVDND